MWTSISLELTSFAVYDSMSLDFIRPNVSKMCILDDFIFCLLPVQSARF